MPMSKKKQELADKLSLSRDDSETLVNQLVHQIADMIDAGEMLVGARMPSPVKLSKAVKVAYCTVETAYRQLSEQGYIERNRRGSFVKYPLMKPRVTMARKMARKVVILFGDQALEESLFTQKVVRGIQDVLKEPAYILETMRASDFQAEGLDWSEELAANADYDALIIDKEGVVDRESLNFAKKAKVPFLLFGSMLWSCYHSSLTILPDYGYGIHQVVDHLTSLGHKRIALILRNRGNRPDYIKEQSFRDAMDAPGLNLDESMVLNMIGNEDNAVDDAVAFLLAAKSKPTAIVCGDDIVAYEAMMSLRTRGVSVPQEMSIVGYNNFDVCSIAKPNMTTVHVPMRQMGQTIAEKLLERMAGKTTSGLVHIPVNLVVRDTTGPLS